MRTDSKKTFYKQFLPLSSLHPPSLPSSYLKLLAQTLHLLQLVLVPLQLSRQRQGLRLGLPGTGLRLVALLSILLCQGLLFGELGVKLLLFLPQSGNLGTQTFSADCDIIELVSKWQLEHK